MNITPFLRRIFGIVLNNSNDNALSEQPTTFIILPYKLIQDPITKQIQLFNPLLDSQLAINFCKKILQLQEFKVIFYLLLEKIIMQQEYSRISELQ